VVLEDMVDHANVGAIFRCAAGLGIDAVLLAPRCADRSTAVRSRSPWRGLRRPVHPAADWRSGLAELRRPGSAAGLTRRRCGARGRDHFPRRLALLLGTEGDGLSARWLEAADAQVRIPMRGEWTR